MRKKQQTAEHYDGAYIKPDGGVYGGKMRFNVRHPAQRAVTVDAPDENSAIVTAASIWGVPWTKYEIYAYTTVTKA